MQVLLVSVLSVLLIPATSLWHSSRILGPRSRILPHAFTAADISETKDIILSDSYSGLSRAEINEYVVQLEKKNPTPSPATSALINGVWEVVFTSGFGSPGLVGFQVVKSLPLSSLVDLSALTLTISSATPRATASTTLKVGNLQLDISVVTDLEVESAARLKESYVSGKIGSVEIPLTSIKTYSRNLLITYVDDDLLIARDEYGSPEILRRKLKEFQSSSLESEPSVNDESGAPGSG